ncbi:hypothetical protein MBRA_01680 [Methylobacterium brachiatum]|nr:hypothetical protein MBRA_01680 [Methylobacterium brachiatum]
MTILATDRTEPEAGHWGLAGGKVDLFEPVADAVKREVTEELGIGIEPVTLLCVVDHIDADTGIHWVAPVYRVDAYSGAPRLVEPDKHDGLDWFALEAPPEPLTLAAKTAIALIRQGQTRG